MVRRNYMFFLVILIVALTLLASINLYFGLGIIAVILLIFLLIKQKFFLVAIILFNEYFFYVINTEKIPMINIKILLIILFALVNLRNIKKLKFKWEVLLMVLLGIIGAIVSNRINNQSVMLGIQAAKYIYIYLLYFYVINTFRTREELKYIEDCIVYIGVIMSIVFIIQYFLFNKFIFLNIQFANPRIGITRFYNGFTVIIFSLFLSLGRLLNTNTKDKSMIFIVFLQLFSIIFISQTRNFIISILFSIVLIILVQRKYNKFFFIPCVLLGLLGIVLCSDNNALSDLIKSAINDVINNSGTFSARSNAVSYFASQIKSHPLFGLGFYSLNFSESYYILGLNYNYYLSDVGLIGFMYQTGIVGIVVFILLLTKLFMYIKKLYKNKIDILGYIGFFVYTIGTMFSTFYYSLNETILYIVLLICMVEIKHRIEIEDAM